MRLINFDYFEIRKCRCGFFKKRELRPKEQKAIFYAGMLLNKGSSLSFLYFTIGLFKGEKRTKIIHIYYFISNIRNLRWKNLMFKFFVIIIKDGALINNI